MNDVQQWFCSFTGGFVKDKGDLEPLLALKLHHSFRVSDEAGRLARELGHDETGVGHAEILGLLHDVGRFPQYRDFGTFYDAVSVDHGELGWETVSNSRVLEFLEEGSMFAILDGIRYHNKKEIPRGIRPGSLHMVRLVRDADKLDVFELVQGYLEEGRIRELLPRIPETGKISEELVETLAKNGQASYGQVTCMADFLLVQLSWVFDLNYAPSFQRILDRRVIERIEKRLPAEPRVRSLIEKARKYAQSSAAEGGRS